MNTVCKMARATHLSGLCFSYRIKPTMQLLVVRSQIVTQYLTIPFHKKASSHLFSYGSRSVVPIMKNDTFQAIYFK
jgi:hypothetical protein